MPDAATIRRVFEGIQRSAFIDADADARAGIDVIDAGVAGDTQTFVLVTPWTLSGLAFPPDDEFPDTIAIDGREYRTYRMEIPALGRHRCVNLMPDPPHASAGRAHDAAEALAPRFRRAVQRARAAAPVTAR